MEGALKSWGLLGLWMNMEEFLCVRTWVVAIFRS